MALCVEGGGLKIEWNLQEPVERGPAIRHLVIFHQVAENCLAQELEVEPDPLHLLLVSIVLPLHLLNGFHS